MGCWASWSWGLGPWGRLVALLHLHLLQCHAVHLGSKVPLGFVRQAVRAAVAGDSAHTLDVDSSTSSGRRLQTLSELKHNGTHWERFVHAKWQCTFPNGDCYKSHAPMEGLPDQLSACTDEHSASQLEVVMAIDLTCAKMDEHIKCKSAMKTKTFDPFLLCNNDPLLLKASCHLECRTNSSWKGFRPFEICHFQFDLGGKFNMSDKTIESCNLDAMCKSPYVEQNEMFCSGHKSAKKHQSHWLTEKGAWQHREKHGMKAPPVQQSEEINAGGVAWVPRSLPSRRGLDLASLATWLLALFMLLLGATIQLGRQDWLPGPLQEVFEDLMDRVHGIARARHESHQARVASSARRGPGKASLPYQPSSTYSAPKVTPTPDDEAVEFAASS